MTEGYQPKPGGIPNDRLKPPRGGSSVQPPESFAEYRERTLAESGAMTIREAYELAVKQMHTLNAEPFRGFPAGTLKIVGVETSAFPKVEFLFAHKPDDWTFKVDVYDEQRQPRECIRFDVYESRIWQEGDGIEYRNIDDADEPQTVITVATPKQS